MRVMFAMVFDGVSPAHDISRQFGVASNLFSDAEERCLGAESIKHIQNRRCNPRVRSVVEGHGDFLSRRSSFGQVSPIGAEQFAAWP